MRQHQAFRWPAGVLGLVIGVALLTTGGCRKSPTTLDGNYANTETLQNNEVTMSRTDTYQFTPDGNVTCVVTGKMTLHVPGVPQGEDLRRERKGAYTIKGNKVECLFLFDDGVRKDSLDVFEIRGDELVMKITSGENAVKEAVFQRVK